MLDIYADTIENLLAIPVLKGEKTEKEKFAGAENTYTIETLMYDGKALQAATSHYFGQNFTKPFDVTFQDRNGNTAYPYQTSWGSTTRLIGAVIMAHGDNRGLKLPPRVAPIQAVIVPIAMHKEGVEEKAKEIYNCLKSKFRMEIDLRDNYSPGFKFNYWEMKGVPIRIEIGPKDIENGVCILVRRDTLEKITVELDKLEEAIAELLNKIHDNMYKECAERVKEKTSIANTLEEFKEKLEKNQGFIKTMWCGSKECEETIKEETGAKSRCMPFNQEKVGDRCVVCGKHENLVNVVWGRQY